MIKKPGHCCREHQGNCHYRHCLEICFFEDGRAHSETVGVSAVADTMAAAAAAAAAVAAVMGAVVTATVAAAVELAGSL